MLQPKALAVVNEVRKAILGKDAVVCKVLMAILARGHILLPAWARPPWPWPFPKPWAWTTTGYSSPQR